MASHLAQKYAYLLTKEDTKQLFQTLKKIYGSIQNAALKCGIQRKTVYDWQRTADVKLTTKMKILEATIKTRPDYTLRFLLERSEERASEILYVMLTRFFEKATTQELDQRTCMHAARKFELLRKKHAGLIFEHLEEEVDDMSRLIRQRCESLRVSLPPTAIETMKPAQILEILPTIAKSLLEKETGVGHLEMAEKFNVPIELVKVSSTISQIVRGPYVERQESETTESPYRRPMPPAEIPTEIKYMPRIVTQEAADSQTKYSLWEEEP